MKITHGFTWRHAAAVAVGLTFAIGLSGCFVLSVHPLYGEGDTVLDPGLVGLWGAPDDPGGETWQFMADGEDGYRLIIRENDSLQIRPGEDGVFAAHLVDLGDRRFMDLFPEEPDGTSDFFKSHVVPAHSLWMIDRQGEVLVLSLMSEDALEALSRDRGVELARLERDGTTVLTAPTNRLQEVLGAHAAEIFPESETLQRLQ